MVKLKYFAWVRERIGKTEEEIELPSGIVSVGDLLSWLQQRDEGYGHALQRPETIRVAINQEHADHAQTIAGAREIALFPPMTGG